MGHSTSIQTDWSLVATDGGAAALAVDTSGRIHYINPIAARVYAKRGAREATGLRISDFMPPAAANERLEAARQVIATGEPLIAHELWGGWALRCTFRRIDSPDNGHAMALMIGCQESDLLEQGAEPQPRTVEFQHVDYGPLAGLTSSELKVMALIGEGMSNAEIAAKLHRAVKTVESHRAALTEKTGSSSRVQLGIMARRAGLVRRIVLTDQAGHAPARH